MTERILTRAEAQEALKALESYKRFIDDAHILEGQWHWIAGADQAQVTLKARLAGPAQWQKIECPICGDMAIATDIPAAQRKPLTTKEIREWWASENGLEDCAMSKLDDFEQVVRAIEAAHNIKENT